MAMDQFNRDQAILQNEFAKEERRHRRENFVLAFVGIITVACVVAIAWPVTTTQGVDGKTTTVSGADESTKSWARTTITVILGAAIGYALKQTPKTVESNSSA